MEFESEPGLKAMFEIKIPLTGYNNMNNFSNSRPPFSQVGVIGTIGTVQFPLLEISPGHYEGLWKVPSNLKDVHGASIEVNVKDDYGNETKQEAAGKLFINTKKK